MNSIDMWRYSDDLSVVDAALLIGGYNPGEIEFHGDSLLTASLAKHNPYGENIYYRPDPFRAVFKGLRNAVLNNRIRAQITHLCRPAGHQYVETGLSPKQPNNNEKEFMYEALLKSDNSEIYSTIADIQAGLFAKIYYIVEPDWHQTTIDVEDLKQWLKSKGTLPEFFFPSGVVEGFRDKNHTRYSPKLACAIAAWEAVKTNKPNLSVKATVAEWVSANAVTFGMVEADGVPSASAVEEVAKVVNWDTKGGANRTGGVATDLVAANDEGPIENFKKVASFGDWLDDSGSDFSDDVPF